MNASARGIPALTSAEERRRNIEAAERVESAQCLFEAGRRDAPLAFAEARATIDAKRDRPRAARTPCSDFIVDVVRDPRGRLHADCY